MAVCPVEQHCLGDYVQRLIPQGVSAAFVDMTQRQCLCLCSTGHMQVLHLDTAAHELPSGMSAWTLCWLAAHLQEPVDCSKLLLTPRLGDVQLEALLPQRVVDRQAPTGVPEDGRLAPLRLPSKAPIVTWVCTFKRWRQIGVDPRWACLEVVVTSVAWTQQFCCLGIAELAEFVMDNSHSPCCSHVHVSSTLKVWPDSSAGSEKAIEKPLNQTAGFFRSGLCIGHELFRMLFVIEDLLPSLQGAGHLQQDQQPQQQVLPALWGAAPRPGA